MRNLIIAKITDLLLNSEYYGDYIRDHGQYARIRHAEIVAGLARANDAILLSLYSKLLQDVSVIPCSVDEDGNYVDVYINHGYGLMVEDGSIHT